MSGNPHGVTSPEKKAELLQRKSSTPLSLKRQVTFTKGLRSKVIEMIRTANPDVNINYDHLMFGLNYDETSQRISCKVVDDPDIARLYHNPDNVLYFNYNVPTKLEVLNMLFNDVNDVYDYDLYDTVKQVIESIGCYCEEYITNDTRDVFSDDNLKILNVSFPDQSNSDEFIDNDYQTRLIAHRGTGNNSIYFIREEASNKQTIDFGNNNLNYNSSDLYSRQQTGSESVVANNYVDG